MSLVLALAFSACAAQDPGEPRMQTPAERACTPAAANWRSTATEADRDRLRDWREAWTDALERAGTGGHGADLAREGVLLDPDAGLAEPQPPAGDYECRTIKVGAQSPGLLDYIAYPPFRCRIRVDDGRIGFTKLTGSQRPIGRLYPDGDRRLVFLGTMQLGDERRAYHYGRDPDRDIAGFVERIGERRWRLVVPSPRFESLLDVIELTPR
jgi:Domain of unknown function (DUF4893)